MSDLAIRQVKVPFKGVTSKSPPVPVWLIPDRRVLSCGSTAHVLVPLETFVRSVLPDLTAQERASARRGVVDHRGLCPLFEGDDALVGWRSLSLFGWRQSCYKNIHPDIPPLGPSCMGRYAYWTIFFAQNVMRGLLTRLVETEMQAIEQDAAGEVFWQPLVAGMQHEIRAYDNIPPVRRVSLFAEREVKEMWQRVLGRVSERNRANLEHCLASRKGDVRKIGEG